jgi:hypothetical protein
MIKTFKKSGDINIGTKSSRTPIPAKSWAVSFKTLMGRNTRFVRLLVADAWI